MVFSLSSVITVFNVVKCNNGLWFVVKCNNNVFNLLSSVVNFIKQILKFI